MDERLLFIIGAPRSGTTLLNRMLNMHEDFYARAETHLLTPLAHLGLYANVDKAPYDPFQSAISIKGFVADLPGGEQDYIDALRAYTDVLYSRMLEPTGKRYFVDKTPANALILPVIAKLFPRAKYVVLTRHPFAVFSSYAKSFFDNDWEAAVAFNPILERYIPAIARFIREKPVELLHVRYEDLVSKPESELAAICDYAQVSYHPDMIEYGNKQAHGRGLGDPIGVSAHDRPITASVDKWASEVAGAPTRCQILQNTLARLVDEDLAIWGYTRENLWDPVDEVDPEAARLARSAVKRWDRHAMKRKALLLFRRNIHSSVRGRLLKQLRFAIDILLR
jgi:hypothetical protein